MPRITTRRERLANERELSSFEKRELDAIADLFNELYAPAIKKLERT